MIREHWNWHDEYQVMLALRRDAALEAYITTSLRRARDFRGRPVTPEWEARLLELAAFARRDRQRAAEAVAS